VTERETEKIPENQAFTRNFVTKEEEATVRWRNIYYENLHQFVSSPNHYGKPILKSTSRNRRKKFKSGD
jgi:hypothetical protein